MARAAVNDAIIEAVFRSHVGTETAPFRFKRQELVDQARRLDLKVPDNLGDTIYSYKSRRPLPGSVRPGGASTNSASPASVSPNRGKGSKQ